MPNDPHCSNRYMQGIKLFITKLLKKFTLYASFPLPRNPHPALYPKYALKKSFETRHTSRKTLLSPKRTILFSVERLFKPKKRVMSQKEMKELNQKVYRRLPEVTQAAVDKRRQEEYSRNRVKANIYKQVSQQV